MVAHFLRSQCPGLGQNTLSDHLFFLSHSSPSPLCKVLQDDQVIRKRLAFYELSIGKLIGGGNKSVKLTVNMGRSAEPSIMAPESPQPYRSPLPSLGLDKRSSKTFLSSTSVLGLKRLLPGPRTNLTDLQRGPCLPPPPPPPLGCRTY